MPDKKHMEICWTNNPDGAGLAVWREDEGVWEVEKGFMYRDDFNEAYERMDLSKDDLFILHWRIATSGLVDEKRTHPFPVSDRCRNMLKLKYKRKKIVFHNGVIGGGTKEHSDTMIGIRDWIYPLWKYLSDDKVYYMLEDLWSPSRVLVCDGDAIAEFGTWIHGEGLLWSNDGYKVDKWIEWARAAEERKKKYGGMGYGVITKATSVFADAMDWNSPYRNEVTGEFDWGKFEKATETTDRETMWDDWELANEAEQVAPGDSTDCPVEEAVIGMVDDNEKVHMDATYHEEKVTKDFLMCPHCYEDKYLQETPFNCGDTICLVCGCVYTDPTGEQVYFDPDINAGFIDHQREVANG